jgi:hypothetical protein
MAAISVSAHGTSFHVEDPSRVERVTRVGWGLEVAAYRRGGRSGSVAWVHAPIAIVAAWELLPLSFDHRIVLEEIEERVQLTQVAVAFDASADRLLHVRNLHLWNGGTRVAAFDDLDERGPWLTRSFQPWLEIDGARGLNMSIGVEFPFAIDVPNPPPAPALVLNAAYAFFAVQA